ncbi:MAG: hypothetical protein JWN60_1001 [Acidobacteria bacterium]|jgi:hypothetical protein|nr:hypothetical protein [Acidobacteriota bacterium]
MTKIILGINLILLLSVFAFAQKQKNNPDSVDSPEPTKRKQVAANGKSANNNKGSVVQDGTGKKVLLESGSSLEGQLQSTLDVKKTDIGDKVVLKTTKAIKQEGSVIIPKGTRLIGTVTEIQEKSKNSPMSKIGVVFEQIEGKNLSAPFTASIVSVSQIASQASAGSLFDSDLSGSSSSSGSVSRSGSASGGLLGGGGGLLGGATNVVGSTLSTATNTVGGVVNTAGQTVGGASQSVGNIVNGIRITQSANASGSGSTTLSSDKNNLRLEKGAVFQLQLNKSIESQEQ